MESLRPSLTACRPNVNIPLVIDLGPVFGAEPKASLALVKWELQVFSYRTLVLSDFRQNRATMGSCESGPINGQKPRSPRLRAALCPEKNLVRRQAINWTRLIALYHVPCSAVCPILNCPWTVRYSFLPVFFLLQIYCSRRKRIIRNRTYRPADFVPLPFASLS